MIDITTDTRRAVVHDRFGDPAEVIAVEKLGTPEIGTDEVLVEVAAVGIGVGDWLAIAGLPYIARPSYGLRRGTRVAGQELAGTVVAVGEGVTELAEGDEVLGFAKGAFADTVAVAADSLVRKPANISSEEAAAIPVSAVAAYQALVHVGGVEPGQSVLVLGASGAVGTYTVQIAKAMGASVTGVAGTTNLELVRRIGADDVIDYRTETVTERDRTFDVIVDLVGNLRLRELRRVLEPNGIAVLAGGSGGKWLMSLPRIVRAMAFSPFVSPTFRPLFSSPDSGDLTTVRDLVARGAVTPIVDRAVPVAEVGDVLAGLGKRHASGKTVLTF
jgi:NADPH:quinone reductase-like Zn-dependent oxidoreductase